jgi:NDP-sugar pyrophosphorylase family protein
MQSVILVGGLATRLRPVTEKIPKSMIKICEKPFLEYQIELLKDNGVFDIVLCLGCLGFQIKEYFRDGKRFGVEIKYSEDGEKLLGTAGALKKAERYLKDQFFLLYGDSYLPYDYEDIKKYLNQQDLPVMMVIHKNENRFDRSNVVVENGRIKVYDKKNQTKDMVYIDSGLSVLRKEVLGIIPESSFCDLEKLYQKLIEEEKLAAYETKQRFFEIGSFAGLEEFENLIKGRFDPAHRPVFDPKLRSETQRRGNAQTRRELVKGGKL